MFILNSIQTKKRTIYIVDELSRDKFKNITKEISYKYGIKMPNRDLIIKTIIASLVHGDFKNYLMPQINISVTRSDIKNFYPTIDKHKLYQRINSSNVLSQESLTILKKIFFNNKYEGIPLGLSFSNHLAELYIEHVDKNIKLKIKPSIYFRYIDDFIFIEYCDFLFPDERIKYEKERKNHIESILRNQKLKSNKSKTETTYYLINKNETDKNCDLNFIYLGYQFRTNNGKLIIEIADSKLKNYKIRLNKYFYEFRKSKRRKIDFWKLYYKVLNELHGVIRVDNRNRKMKTGLAYNYRYVNDYEHLTEFVTEYKNIIFSLNLSSYELHLLLNLFGDKNNKIIFMQKRFNYLKLTLTQKNLISNRLNFQSSELNTKNFAKKIFKTLY